MRDDCHKARRRMGLALAVLARGKGGPGRFLDTSGFAGP
jgi:hypothetical protein